MLLRLDYMLQPYDVRQVALVNDDVHYRKLFIHALIFPAHVVLTLQVTTPWIPL